MKSDLKVRVISAIVALIIVIPILIIGSYAFFVGACIIGCIGFYEMLSLRNKKKEIPLLMKILSFLCFLTLTATSIFEHSFSIDYRLLVIVPLVLLSPLLFYGKSKKYDAEDALFVMASVFFLGIAFRYLVIFRNFGIHFLLYLLMITIMTDTFAHFFGTKIGRNKLCPYVSPNKTIEGMIGGTIMGTFIGTVYYITFTNSMANIFSVIGVTLVLSLVAQIGDLVFSAIKRKYDVKDYGNIMPGHGGVLDRLDSLIFAMLAFSILCNSIIGF